MKLIVGGGIGNRLIPICSAIRICSIINEELELFWNPDPHNHTIPDDWSEFFDFPVKKISGEYPKLEDADIKGTTNVYNKNRELYYCCSSLKFEDDPMEMYVNDKYLFDMLLPHVKSIMPKEHWRFHATYDVGIHLRVASYNCNPDIPRLFRGSDGKSVYFCWDREDLFYHIKPNYVKQDSFDQAIFDLMTLSHCPDIRGTRWSSFSQLAGLYGAQYGHKYIACGT